MKGDFSRVGFDPTKHFSQVLLQQGRVTLDADPNEQGAILLHLIRTLARDLVGPYGGPIDNLGFRPTLAGSGSMQSLSLGAGRYYVDGILVENDQACDYAQQPDFTPASTDPVLQRLAASAGDDVWLYLDVWERHVSWIEDDSIREPALGGPDTCSRAQVVWQVRGLARGTLVAQLQALQAALQAQLEATGGTLSADQRAALQAQSDQVAADLAKLTPNADGEAATDCKAPLDALAALSNASMTARLDPGSPVRDACSVSPESRYRGLENQLYRIEIHRGSAPGVSPTFKWSRDNGSVASPWLDTDGNDLVVESGRGFDAGNWVELADDSNDLGGQPGVLVKVLKVDRNRLTIDPTTLPAGASAAWSASLSHPKVRRWDQAETDAVTLDQGAVPLLEASATLPNWITLEDGLQVQFTAGGTYRSGDYWQVPARVATGSIEWPGTTDASGNITWLAEPPAGVVHHYAPIGWLSTVNGALEASPCLCQLEPINGCVRMLYNLAAAPTTAAAAKTVRIRPAPATPASRPAPKPASRTSGA